MIKICLIRQPAGIGDILICKKIGVIYQLSGYEIIWPIHRALLDLIPYITTDFNYICEENPFPFCAFYNKSRGSQFFFDSDTQILKYLPLQYATDYCQDLILQAKFTLAGMDHSDWSKYLFFNRNHEKENHLYYNILGLKDKEEYLLLNPTYGTPPAINEKNIPFKTSKKIVKISMIPGITVFDWCKVIENASEIHMMDTCFTTIIEKLNLQTDNLFLYNRDGSPDNPSYNETIYMYSKPWKLCYLP
jgi:hypothetical protein